MTPSNNDNQLPTIAPGPGPLRELRPLTKNRKSSSACMACKHAKRKCTGQPGPCKACRATGGECRFDETLDLRRKVAAKKTVEDRAKYRNFLYSLLNHLRTANDEEVQRLLKIIREYGDLKDDDDKFWQLFDIISESGVLENIATTIRASSTDEPTIDGIDISAEYISNVASTDDNHVQHENLRFDQSSRIKVQRLIDTPLCQVPCKPWTTVTDDSHLVSHLISLYFTWDHPLMQVVDQKLFLHDMKAGNTSSEFCNPVLVNSILAVASTYSDYPEVYAVPGRIASRGQHFFVQAEKHWKGEEGRPSLANIQALVLMSHNLKLQGKDNASWLLLRQAVQLGQDIGMFNSPRIRHRQWDQMPENLKRGIARTAWGIFILNSQMSMESRKPANLEVPKLIIDETDDFDKNVNWAPYPRPNHEEDGKPALLRDVMARLAGLTEITVDIQDLLFEKAFDMGIHEVWEGASRLYMRVERFLTSLTDTAIIDDKPVPQMLFVHIKAYHIIIELLGYFLEQPEFEPSLGSSTAERARSKRIDAAKQVVQIFRLFGEHYGLPQTPSLMLGPALSSASTLSNSAYDDEPDRTLSEVLDSFSKRFPAANQATLHIDPIRRASNITSPSGSDAVVDGRGSEEDS